MSNYATKSDLINAAGVNTSKFAKKVDLTGLKSDIDKLDVDKLKIVSVDLYKLRHVVENDGFKITVCDELVKRLLVIRLLMLII